MSNYLRNMIMNCVDDEGPTPLTFMAESAGATVKLTKSGSPTVDGVQYRMGTSGGWTQYTIDTVLTLTNIGDCVQFQNTLETLGTSTSNYATFVITRQIAASGNLMSMLNYSNTVSPYAFKRLFRGCSSLTSAPDIIADTVEEYGCESGFDKTTSLRYPPLMTATTIGKAGYISMFSDSGLYEAPELPATTIGVEAYRNMFFNCKSLVKVPTILPATTLANNCYTYMFHGCTSLTTAPIILPATTLATYCYHHMFEECSNLTSVPELPATTLASNCYSYMFYNCKSLVKAPELPATTLGDSSYCYQYMFRGCTSLTSAPELPATSMIYGCYSYMFEGCTSLTSAPELPATTLGAYCYSYMFKQCTSLTSAPELPATSLAVYCYQYMFEGCTSLTSAPELPATTMINGCYKYMFKQCTSLTSAPELPATTLVTYCYQYMFEGCTNLNYIKVEFTEWHYNAINNWVDGVSLTGTFEAPRELPIEYGTSRIPTNWDLPGHLYIILVEDQLISQNFEDEVNYTIQYKLYPETLKPTFTIIDGSLPEGLSLDSSTGVITGTSTTTFEGNLTIQLSAEGCESVTIVLYLNLYEAGVIQTTPHNLTSNTSDPRYEVSQSTNLGDSRLAWNAMDGSLLEGTGCSHTKQNSNQWWKIKFNEGLVSITKVTWTNRTGGIGLYLKNPYKIQGSNDDSTWTTVYTINDMVNASEAVRSWEIEGSTKYQYWRILQEGYSYLIIGELEFEYTL